MIRATIERGGADPHLWKHADSGPAEKLKVRSSGGALGARMSEFVSQNSMAEAPVKRSVRKRSLILSAAMHHFANHGYEAARVGDMASQLGIAKGSVFQHFGSKDGLFFEAYKSALRALPAYLDVPQDVKNGGFFTVVRYRLSLPVEFWKPYWVPYRVLVLSLPRIRWARRRS